jgi:hypothetical protein
MIGTRRTDLQYLDLDHLTIDSIPVAFTSATVTIETVHTQGPQEEWTADPPRWYGQIVSDSRPAPQDMHALVAQTRDGQTLTGLFLVGWSHSRGIDVTGVGELVIE